MDIAHASLLMHHFDPDDAVMALAEMRRVSRLGVVINDLRRGLVPFAMTAAAVLALSRGAYTRHDGVLSARRAYTLAELDTLAARAGLVARLEQRAILAAGHDGLPMTAAALDLRGPGRRRGAGGLGRGGGARRARP